MKDYTVIIGGKAGDGIQQAGLLIAGLFNAAGYNSFMYYDYPSLIRGGHNFSVIRASDGKISALREKADLLVALNRETIDIHSKKLKEPGMILCDSGNVGSCGGTAIAPDDILKREDAPGIMKNSCLAGALAKACGLSHKTLESAVRRNLKKQTELNLKVALAGYRASKKMMKISSEKGPRLPLMTGNDAMGLGLAEAGLETYYAYPMTPSSGLLHFMSEISEDYGIKAVHAESEIAVMLMALGSAYAGKRTAVGTSGGGFCLMTEGFSFSGMAEIPVTVMLGQRPGPSTGLPTYTCQSELFFPLYAGQGEFPRFIAAPGDAEEAFSLAQTALNLSWSCQVPSVLLCDKMLCESAFSFDLKSAEKPVRPEQEAQDGDEPYGRYRFTRSGVSPMAFPGEKKKVVKVNSYEHDELGLTTEDPEKTTAIQEKRLRKGKRLEREIKGGMPPVRVGGLKKSKDALVCWGSNKGPAEEAARKLGLRLVRPLVISPFPEKDIRKALKGAGRVIVAENNATGQLAGLMRSHGIEAGESILKYDGRPFYVEELENRIKEVTR